MIGEAGVLSWEPRSPGPGLPRGVPKDSFPTNQTPTATPATRPPLPGRGRSASSKGPSSPTGWDPVLRVPRLRQNPLPRRAALLACTPPLSAARGAATSAAVRTWSSAPPRAAQGRSTQAQRWRGGLHASEATREGEAGALAHAQAGAWARLASPAGKMAVGVVRVCITQ